MIAKVAQEIGVPLAPKRLYLPGGAYCDVDGVAEDESVLAEAYAHHGKMIGANKKKVTDDALKLITLARTLPGVKLIIALADHVAARSFLGTAWRAAALKAWEIEVLVVDLDRETVVKVQRRAGQPANEERRGYPYAQVTNESPQEIGPKTLICRPVVIRLIIAHEMVVNWWLRHQPASKEARMNNVLRNYI